MARDLCSRMGMVLGVLFLGVFGGCSGSAGASDRTAPTVYLDPALNGAARTDSTRQRGPTVGTGARKLAFVAQGTGLRPGSGSDQERKLAMSQAAIIDALGDAVAESRRLAGQPSDEFTSDLGPRASISRRGGDAGETELRLMTAGGMRTLLTRGGVLQSRPCDLATIQRAMQATGGQYALLSVEESTGGSECVASVARYELDATAIAKGSTPDTAR